MNGLEGGSGFVFCLVQMLGWFTDDQVRSSSPAYVRGFTPLLRRLRLGLRHLSALLLHWAQRDENVLLVLQGIRTGSRLTLERGANKEPYFSSEVVGFQPLNHSKQTCKTFPNNNHGMGKAEIPRNAPKLCAIYGRIPLNIIYW